MICSQQPDVVKIRKKTERPQSSASNMLSKTFGMIRATSGKTWVAHLHEQQTMTGHMASIATPMALVKTSQRHYATLPVASTAWTWPSLPCTRAIADMIPMPAPTSTATCTRVMWHMWHRNRPGKMHSGAVGW